MSHHWWLYGIIAVVCLGVSLGIKIIERVYQKDHILYDTMIIAFGFVGWIFAYGTAVRLGVLA